MNDCIFCKIVNKEAPASVVFEDDISLAIEPLEPVSAGHTLVISKQHFVNMLDTDDAVLAHLAVVSKQIGKKLVEKYNAQAINFLHAAGKEAQQSVFHTHFHIVPRHENDGLDLWFRNKF
ncbi:HIT domain-containing protein [Patescibacteria group bacterium]|nr:HIT domain-containing protein [Patescibacteria group bacterium]